MNHSLHALRTVLNLTAQPTDPASSTLHWQMDPGRPQIMRIPRKVPPPAASHFSAVLAASMVALGMGPAHAESVVVICHPALELDAGEIRQVFLGTKQLSGSTRLVPVDNNSLQEAFLGKIVHLDRTRYGSHWTMRSLCDGETPPPLKEGDAEVIEFVRCTPGAVGYVKSAGAGVITVMRI